MCLLGSPRYISPMSTSPEKQKGEKTAPGFLLGSLQSRSRCKDQSKNFSCNSFSTLAPTLGYKQYRCPQLPLKDPERKVHFLGPRLHMNQAGQTKRSKGRSWPAQCLVLCCISVLHFSLSIFCDRHHRNQAPPPSGPSRPRLKRQHLRGEHGQAAPLLGVLEMTPAFNPTPWIPGLDIPFAWLELGPQQNSIFLGPVRGKQRGPQKSNKRKGK